MSRTASARSAKPRRFALLTGVVAALALVLAPAVATGAQPAHTVTPTGVVATVSTTQAGLGGEVPDVLAEAGVTPITLTLALVPAGSTFNKDTTFNLDVSLAEGGTPAGSTSPRTVTLPARQSSGSFVFTYSAIDNGVVITPQLTGETSKKTPFTSVPAAPFDSLKSVHLVDMSGGATSVGVDVCTAVSSDLNCATAFLPLGSASALAATTVGACTSGLGCPAGSEVVGFMADLGTKYTRDQPAQITIRCDESRCGNGSILDYAVTMSFEASGPLDLVSRPCVAKGVADDGLGNDFCTDYVSSSRDGGDLLLVVNVLHDWRGAV